MDLSAVILAGGGSTRMARDKAWIEDCGTPLLVRAVRVLREMGVKQIFISGRHGGDYASLDCPVLYDLEPGCGPLGGIERGLHEMETSLLLVLAVDLPLVTPDFLTKLAAHCDAITGVVPVLDGRIEPLVAIYPRRCHGLAMQCLARNCRAARDFAAAGLREGSLREFRVSSAEASHFTNFNTPADLEREMPAPFQKAKSLP